MSYNWQRAKEQEVDNRLILGPEQDVTGFRENMEVAYDFMVGEGLSSSAANVWRDPVEQQAKLLLDEPELSSFDRQILRGGSLSAKRDMLRKYQDTVAQRKNERPESGYRTHDEILEDIRKTLEPARKRYEDVSARATGWGVLGNLVGGFGGAVTDPINIATLAIATPRALYASGTLLQQAVKMAAFTGAVSAGTEAAIQPFVYEFKDEIGSPYTFKDAATNVLYAGVFGGVLGGLIPPAGYAAKAVTNRLVSEYRAKVASGQIKQDGDTQAAADVVEQFEEIIADNPLGMTDKGVQAHLEALDTARAQMVAGEPVDVQAIVAPHQRGIQSDSAATIPLDPREIDVDAELFQFKSLADAEGVTDRLAGVTKWEPELAGTSIVWQRKDGKLFVADGHQRLGLARRLVNEGADPDSIVINAFVLREADGYSAREAMARAAAKNIAEGTGTAVDAAKVLRLAQTEGWGSRLPELPPNSALVRDARGLVKLGDEAFRAVVNEVIDDRYAALIGRFIDGDEQQLAAIQAMAKASPDNLMQAEIMARDMAAAGFTKSDQGNLFGDADFETLFKERAKAVDTIAKTLRQDRRTFKTLVDRQADIMGHGQNRLDVEANNLRASQDQLALASLMADATTPGPLSDAINQAARDIKAGVRPGKAIKPALEILRKNQPDGVASLAQQIDALPAAVRRPAVMPPDDPAYSFTLAKDRNGNDVIKISIDRAMFDQEAPNFGYPELPETLPDNHPLLRDTQQKHKTKDGAYTKARQKLHKAILEDALKDAPPNQAKPIAVLMGGGGASGKGATLGRMQEDGALPKNGFVHIDPDKIKESLPEYEQVFKAGDWRGAAVTHEESSDIAKSLQEQAMAERRNIIIDKTLGNAKKGLKLIDDLKSAGYEVHLVGVTIAPDEALIRALERYYNSGQLPLVREMVKAHKGFNGAFDDYAAAADNAVLWDNMKRGGTIVGTKGYGEPFQVIDELAYNRVGGRANLDENAETIRQLRDSAGRAQNPELFDAQKPIDDARGVRADGMGADARGEGQARPDPQRPAQAITDSDADLFAQAQRTLEENPDLEIPELRLDEDGNAVSATRPAREVFAELDAEGRAIDDLITCISGSA